MSLFDIFLDPSDNDPAATLRERIAQTQQESQNQVDLASRIADLERDVAASAIIIESLISLLDERVGLPRREIVARINNIQDPQAEPAIEPEPHVRAIDGAIDGAIDHAKPVPIVPRVKLHNTQAAEPDEEKTRFTPRRNWRDARGSL